MFHKPPSTKEQEGASPTSQSMSNLDKVSVLKVGLEERSCSGLADEEEEEFTLSWARALLGKRANPQRDLDAIATKRSVFDDPQFAPFYWPKQDYENIHRFDPTARWTYREEKVNERRLPFTIC